MFIEKKKIGKGTYNYLRISARVGGTVKTKTIAYLGKGNMGKAELEKAVSSIPKRQLDEAKAALAGSSEDLNKAFLSDAQLGKMAELKRDFARKLKSNDKRLLDDMFRDFKTYYIYNTNSIEGNTLTLEETGMLLNENRTPAGKDLREVYDHVNEREAFDWLLDKRPEIDLRQIIWIHSMLLKNIDVRVGGFRKHNVRVLGADFNTTPAEYVYTDMNLLMKWYRSNKRRLHPLILAALFHEKFERIHPFYDGNGRTGRMLLNLILLRSGFPPLIVENKTRKGYYAVLSAGHKADITKSQPEHYKQLVDFCYKQLLGTYERIFSKWG
ncbi:Fic family protein [archaeon]|nr:Fic family protein [archaeon]